MSSYGAPTETLSINRNLAGIGDRGIYTANVPSKHGNTLKLQIYLDRLSVEVFAMTDRPPHRLVFTPIGKKVEE